MTPRQQAEKVRNEIFELAEEFCPYKGKDNVITGMEAIKENGTIIMKRSIWIDGFIKAILTIRKIESVTGQPININHQKHE